MVPTLDRIEVGAGGGSTAPINNLGLPNVGPQSAGADSVQAPALVRTGALRPRSAGHHISHILAKLQAEQASVMCRTPYVI
jgi:N-methylhydantoinase A/oxoprolinase/acetone carboxylase beta subunit